MVAMPSAARYSAVSANQPPWLAIPCRKTIVAVAFGGCQRARWRCVPSDASTVAGPVSCSVDSRGVVTSLIVDVSDALGNGLTDDRSLLPEVKDAVRGADLGRDHVSGVEVVRVAGLPVEEDPPLEAGREEAA